MIRLIFGRRVRFVLLIVLVAIAAVAYRAYRNRSNWEPDGEWIVFACERPSFQGPYSITHIYRVRPDGGDIEQLTDDGNFNSDPSWAPSGDWVLFATYDNVFKMRPDGSETSVFLPKGNFTRYPVWSPDGQHVAFVRTVFSYDDAGNVRSSRDVHIANTTNYNIKRLTFDENASHLVWSPNSEWIAFTSWRDGEEREIYIMRADGTEQQAITNNDVSDAFPAWSPDGDWILYASGPYYSVFDFPTEGWNLYRVHPDGRDRQMLIDWNGYQGSGNWSPDGEWIIFSSSPDVNVYAQLYRVHLETGYFERLTWLDCTVQLPKWSPRVDSNDG